MIVLFGVELLARTWFLGAIAVAEVKSDEKTEYVDAAAGGVPPRCFEPSLHVREGVQQRPPSSNAISQEACGPATCGTVWECVLSGRRTAQP